MGGGKFEPMQTFVQSLHFEPKIRSLTGGKDIGEAVVYKAAQLYRRFGTPPRSSSAVIVSDPTDALRVRPESRGSRGWARQSAGGHDQTSGHEGEAGHDEGGRGWAR